MFKATTSLGIPVAKDPLSDFRKFLFVIWKHLNLPDPTPVHYDIAYNLQHGDKRMIIQAFRGVGKSWITSAYVVWLLYIAASVGASAMQLAAQREDERRLRGMLAKLSCDTALAANWACAGSLSQLSIGLIGTLSSSINIWLTSLGQPKSRTPYRAARAGARREWPRPTRGAAAAAAAAPPLAAVEDW